MADPAVRPDVLVVVHDETGVPRHTYREAFGEIEGIFSDGGIELELEYRRARAADGSQPPEPLRTAQTPECSPDAIFTVDVQLSTRFPRTFRAEAVGFAYPFAERGIRVTMMYDRVRSLARNLRKPEWLVFASTLAHEIGHVVLGSDLHAGRGLMRGFWNLGDFVTMSSFVPRFDDIDADVMRRRLARWKQRNRKCAQKASVLDAGG